MSQYTENYHLEKPESNDDFENFLGNYGSNMDIIDEHLGQGGGGSSVSWQQLQVTGDKIATIRISGIETDVYSPNARTFSMAISRANINSGEDYSTIFGKIKKYFADLKTVAFTANASDLTNDAGFITNTVNNLANYYLKSETYTQAEVNALIGAITTIHFEVVQTLPTSDIQTNVIYLVPKSTAGTNDVYDEYINTTGTSAGWELIGSTQVDLSNYYTKAQTDTLLAGKVSSVTVTQIQTTGTKIATIDVDGTSIDLYASNGGSGHTIVNESGTDLADEPNLQFTDGLKASDDNVNSKTKVGVDTAFTEAGSRTNIASGDSFSTILGKIKKFFTDLKAVAFSGSYNDLSDKPTIPDISTKVSKTGDTMSGALTIQNVGDAIEINRANSSTYSGWIVFKNSGGVIGQYSVDQNGRPRYIANNDSSDIKQIAFTSDIPDISTKVSKSGDTMTGTLNVQTENNVCINLRPGNADWYDTISTQTSGNEAVVFATKKDATSWIFVNGEDSVTNHASNRWQSLTPALQIKKNCIAIGKLIASASDPTYKCEINGVTYSKGIVVEGRAYNSGDDEGIVIKPSNGWAGVILGSHNAERSCFYFKTGSAFWRYSTGQTNYDISHPKKAGTIALTSDIPTNTNQLTNGAGFITSSGSCASATSFNGLYVKKFTSGSDTSIQIKFKGSVGTGFVKVMGDGNYTAIDFLIPVHSTSLGSAAGQWATNPNPYIATGSNMWAVVITVTAWTTIYVVAPYEFY